jgi:hypothetical protein
MKRERRKGQMGVLGALLEEAADVPEVDVGVRGPLSVARIVIVVAAHEFSARIEQLVKKLVLPILRAAEVEVAVEVEVGSILHVDGAVSAIIEAVVPAATDFRLGGIDIELDLSVGITRDRVVEPCSKVHMTPSVRDG